MRLIAALIIGLACMVGFTTGHATEKSSGGMHQVLVVGATGQTGRLIVADLLDEGYPVRVLVRDAAKARQVLGDQVQVFQGDVKQPETLAAAFAGADAVVSALSSRAATGPDRPETIDYAGVKNLAGAAAAAGVRQMVLISSRSVTHPESRLNQLFGNVLIWKLKGEDALRASGVPYTVVRPGGLTNDAGGVRALRFEQGDSDTSGLSRISRADVARVCVAALKYPAARNRTFEVSAVDGSPAIDWQAAFAELKADPK